MKRPVIACAVVVALLAVTVGLAETVDSSAVTPRGEPVVGSREPVLGVRLVCPDVVGRTVGQVSRTTRVGVAQPATSATPRGGSVVVRQLRQLASPTARPALRLTRAGTGATFAARGAMGDLVVDATGALAPGLSADIVDRRDGGPYRGLDGATCTPPTGETWALGASTTVGQHTELRLTNADDQAALVDVTLFGTKGAVNAPAGLGLGVAPRVTRTIYVETLAPDERVLLIRVRALSGRVATSVRVQSQQASTPQGVDWLPLAGAPSTRVVVPGLMSGVGPRRLILANPGDTDASATVRVVVGSGAFVPRGLAAVTVPAGRVLVVDVMRALAGRPAAIAVSADKPLVAAGWMGTGPRVNGYAEHAWTAGVPALTDPATSVVNLVHNHFSRLLLSAPYSGATVRITTIAGAGPLPVRSATVRIPAGRTVQVDLAGYAGRRDALVGVTVVPVGRSGPVFAARVTVENGTRSPLITVQPLRSAPVVRTVRPAAADLHAGLPG